MTWTSKFFTLRELTASQTAARNGIDNVPTGAHLANLSDTAERMDAVRALLGKPVRVSSGYRSAALNKAVGGSSTSHHSIGYAVDFDCDAYGSPLEICKAVAASGIKYDQLIHEYGEWVHISFHPQMRRQNLTINKAGTFAGFK